MTKKNHIQRVHIWDDPESRINFLETTLADKEWEAVIYEPVENGTGRLPAIKKQLQEKGYKTQMGKDEHGVPTLTLTHFNHETGLLKIFSELGLTSGVSHTVENMGARLGNIINKAKDTSRFLVSNPAKITGFIYLLGDLVFAFGSSGSSKDGAAADKRGAIGKYIDGFKDNREALTRTYGYLGALQSLIFMNYATEGPEQYRNEFNRKLEEATKDNKSIGELKEWLNADEKQNVHRKIEKNAITIGSIVQIVGRMLYIGRGVMTYKQGKENNNQGEVLSGLANITDGSLSISGWLALASPQKKYDNTKELSNLNPRKAYQALRGNQEKYASGVFLGSSLLGIASGLAEDSLPDGSTDISFKALGKNIKSGIKDPSMRKKMLGGSILLGNATYLAGDVLVGFLPKDKYEGGELDETELLADLVASSVADIPVVLGTEEKQEIIKDVTEYYVNSTLKVKKQSPHPEEIESMTNKVVKIASKLLAGKEAVSQLDKLSERAADLVLNFSETQENPLIEALAKSLSKSDQVAVKEEEITAAISAAVESKKITKKHSITKISKAVMASNIQEPLTSLVKALPGGQTAQEAMDLYAVVQPFITRSHSTDAEKFASEFTKEQEIKSHPRINQSPATGVGIA